METVHLFCFIVDHTGACLVSSFQLLFMRLSLGIRRRRGVQENGLNHAADPASIQEFGLRLRLEWH